MRAVGLAARASTGLLKQQAAATNPRWVVVADPEAARREDWSLLPRGVELLVGPEGVARLAAEPEVDIVVSAIVGSAGLQGTWAALEAGKTVALANKESMVIAGPLVTQLAKEQSARILPVDSEHSAVFQALQAGRREEVRRIILTASGGPFRTYTAEQLAGVSVAEALDHPTWAMGPKVTVDSATLMNKALEIIEARWLFDLRPDQIEVVLHPQSIVHSLVEYVDGSIIAQLSPPDMRLPIQYALTWPQRREGIAASWIGIRRCGWSSSPRTWSGSGPCGWDWRWLERGDGRGGAQRRQRGGRDCLPGRADGVFRDRPGVPGRPREPRLRSPPHVDSFTGNRPLGSSGGAALGSFLIADGMWAAVAGTTLVWVKVLVGLGLVIFVHELGHFVVAKLCGVKCEKFYMGFDIAGWKLCKFKWGETEYGIGILPLGGYVKMLGQEDNPARLREEIERAKLQGVQGSEPGRVGPEGDRVQGSGGTTPGADVASPTPEPRTPNPEPSSRTPNPEPSSAAAAQQALYDPRSYLAKSVPKRMAIISAGVVMNVVFAFVAAMIAYSIGVREPEPVVGSVFPGEAAWRANLMPGDRVLEINGRKVSRWEDLVRSISLGDIDNGLKMLIQRPGESPPREIMVSPDRVRLAPSIGVGNGWLPTLGKKLPVLPFSAAAEAQPPFEPGDRIVKIGDRPIENYRDIRTELASHPADTLEVTVERVFWTGGVAHEGFSKGSRYVTIQLPPAPVRDLGLSMEMGPVTAIQEGSPAEAAGLQVGDLIVKINGAAPSDAMRLPEQLRRSMQTSPQVVLTVHREGREGPLDIPVKLRPVDSYETPREMDPLAVPALGIAVQIGNRIQAVNEMGAGDRPAPGAVGSEARRRRRGGEDHRPGPRAAAGNRPQNLQGTGEGVQRDDRVQRR